MNARTNQIGQRFQNTIWVNDSEKNVKFRLLTNRKTGKQQSGVEFVDISIAPGKSIELPVEFDSAIRTEDDTGRVVGGLCPWLKKDGEEKVNLHPSLDYEAVQAEIEIKELAVKLEKERALSEAVKVHAEKTVAKRGAGRPKKEE